MLQKIDNLPFVNSKNALYLLLAMHVAGAIGLFIEESRELFQILTPFNLLATAAIVLHFEKQKDFKYITFIGLTFLVGYLVEVVGVMYGYPFGSYNYGETLGFKLAKVPLVIGVNWVILSYGSAMFVKKVVKQKWLRITLAAVIMVGIDLVIEPVAIKLDFWTWENDQIPMLNYIGWFGVAFAIHTLFYPTLSKLNNSLAIRLLYIQLAFFIILNFI